MESKSGFEATDRGFTKRQSSRLILDVPQELFRSDPDIPADLSQEKGRDVATSMERNRSAPAVRVAILFMRASLPNLHEAHRLQRTRDFSRAQPGSRAIVKR